MPIRPHRPARPIVLALLASWTVAANARTLVREDFPAQALAISADADRDGFVTREEIADACARAVGDAEKEFAADWDAKLKVYGMTHGAANLDLERIFAATIAMVEGADADGDGRVTPAELKAYVERFDAVLRPDMIQAALALDADADMVLTREELSAARAAFARDLERYKALPAAAREEILHPARKEALATWKASTLRIADAAVYLWRQVAAGKGRASVADIGDVAPDEGDAPPAPQPKAAKSP